MKAKNLDSKSTNNDKHAIMAGKPKSLRPMRSMMAVRSLKSRTTVAGVMVKSEEEISKN